MRDGRAGKALGQFFGQIVYMTGERNLCAAPTRQVTVVFLEHLQTFQVRDDPDYGSLLAIIILKFAHFEEGPIWMNFVQSFLQWTHAILNNKQVQAHGGLL